jgi:hypothetical protein
MSNLSVQPLMQFWSDGVPVSGGQLFFYQASTNIKTTIYQDLKGTPAPNPIRLNANGVPVSQSGVPLTIYLPIFQNVKMVLAPSDDTDPPVNPIYTIDGIVGDSSIDIGTYFSTLDYMDLAVRSGITLDLTDGTLTSGPLRMSVINDVANSPMVTLTHVSSPQNYFILTNAATGSGPHIDIEGQAGPVDLNLASKGTGKVVIDSAAVQLIADQPIQDSSGNRILSFTKTSTAVNTLGVPNIATGGTALITPVGGDAIIPLRIDTKGASILNLGTTSATTVNVGNTVATSVGLGSNTTTALAVGGSSSITTVGGSLNWPKVTVASASTVDLGAAKAPCVDINGTTTITSFGTATAGIMKFVRFTGSLILTHSASLFLPGAANITTTAQDTATFVSAGSGNWVCMGYTSVNVSPNRGLVVQKVSAETSAVATGSTTIPSDNTIPQITEGDQYMSQGITPVKSTSILVIEVTIVISSSAANAGTTALFRDGAVNAIAACSQEFSNFNVPWVHHFAHIMPSASTASTTFTVRAGSNSAGTTTFNGASGARLMGGAMASSVIITEYLF